MSENQGVAGLGLPPAYDGVDKTEERREEIEQTRAGLSETVDATQERLGPEHVVEQAQEAVQETTKNPVGRAREMMQEAVAGTVQPMVSSARDTAKQVASSARDTAKQVASSASDVAKKVLLPASAILFAGGLVIGLICGLLLGLLIDNTVRSGAGIPAQPAAAPEPQDVAPRPWWMVWKRS
jgi:Protein of unknown function (DUF3618)